MAHRASSSFTELYLKAAWRWSKLAWLLEECSLPASQVLVQTWKMFSNFFPPWGWSHTIEFKQSCLRDIFWGGCCLLLTDKYLGLSLLADKPKSTLKEVPSEGYGWHHWCRINIFFNSLCCNCAASRRTLHLITKLILQHRFVFDEHE